MSAPADNPAGEERPAPVVAASDLARHYTVSRGLFAPAATVRALDGVSFSLAPRTTLAVVGESGCGKSTLARVVTMIEPPTRGHYALEGVDIATQSASRIRHTRRKVQMIFQNPMGSLNPRKTVGRIVAEPLVLNTGLDEAARRVRVHAMLARVGLRPEHYGRYPHMFSGGQRQRIAIARALILEPKLVVADEPVSALDVSIQAQVLNLLMDIQDEFGLAYLFISHDLAVVEHIADEVMVLYLGAVVEHGARARIFDSPRHPYTQALLSARPRLGTRLTGDRPLLRGELPSPLDPPPGCAFHTRCPFARADCAAKRPKPRALDGRIVACHYAEDLGPPKAAPAG